jgi:predicted dehydrogenase
MKVGIVGAGAIARRGHLPIYKNLPEAEIVGIADLDISLAKDVAQEFRIPAYYQNVDELLDGVSVDMIDICAPTPAHRVIATKAAERGKHILIEKPLATNLADALEIERAARRNGVKVCICQNYRYFPAVMAARSRVLHGYIGDLVTIHGFGLQPFPSSWTLGTWLYHEGGALYDFGPHVLDMVLWMKDFAPIDGVYASGGDFTKGNMDFVNYSVINIEFTDGTIGVIDISWVTGIRSKVTIDIYGTAGSMAIDVRANVFWETHGMSTPFDDLRHFIRRMVTVGKSVLTGSYFAGSNLHYKPLIGGFLESLNGNGAIPVPIEHGILSMAVLEAAMVSLKEKRRVRIEEVMNLAGELP